MRTTNDEARRPVRHATDRHEAAERYQTSEENAASANASASTDESALEADIRRRAYERYVTRGDTPGSDVEDWYAAEREVRAERETPRSRPT